MRPTGERRGALVLQHRGPGVAAYLRALPRKLRLPAGTRAHVRSGNSVLVPRAAPGVRVTRSRVTARTSRRMVHTLELREAQRGAVAAMVRQGGGVVVAPCGSGKTEIGLALAARWRQRTLVLVGTRDLRDQWVARARAHLRGAVVADRDDPKADVVVLTVQGQARRTPAQLEALGAGFGLVILDEGHHGAAATWQKVILHMPAQHRVALTATLERADDLHGLVVAHFGPVHRITEEQNRIAGATMLPRVRMLVLAKVDPRKRDAWLARLVAEDARRGRRVLVLVRLVDHALELADLIRRAGARSSALVGRMPQAERRRALADIRSGRLQVLVATSLADEGLDVPELDTVVLASSTHSLGRVQQRVGRILRPRRGKSQPVVYDLVEVGGEEAALKREKLYRRLGYPVVVRS